MEVLLWLILLARILWKLAPYALGVVGALFIFRHVAPGIPPGHGLIFFLVVAIGLIVGLKDTLSQK